MTCRAQSRIPCGVGEGVEEEWAQRNREPVGEGGATKRVSSNGLGGGYIPTLPHNGRKPCTDADITCLSRELLICNRLALQHAACVSLS